MVIAGELSVVVSADTSSLEKGSRKTSSAMKDMKKNADSSSGSFERVKQSASGMADKIGLFAKVGVGALTALGLASPMLAGHMAKLKTELFNVGNTMGTVIEPFVNSAIGSLQTFGGFLATHSEGLRFFSDTIVNGASEALQGLGIAWDFVSGKVKDLSAKIGFDVDLGDGFLKSLVSQLGPEAAAAAIGAKFGGLPGAVAAGVGVGVTRRIANPDLITGGEDASDDRRAMGYIGTGAAIGAAVGSVVPGAGTALGAGVGAGAGASAYLLHEMVNLFQTMQENNASKEVVYGSIGTTTAR